jgi:hypothetical protein
VNADLLLLAGVRIFGLDEPLEEGAPYVKDCQVLLLDKGLGANDRRDCHEQTLKVVTEGITPDDL